MNEGETVNEDQTVNESRSQTAGGSGGSPEKQVADYVEDLCRHIADNGYDLLADVAVSSLATDDTVPADAYLHSVKTAWCLHRAAVHYARQHGVERAAADRARGDAQFEHSHRAKAERTAEKLEADLAQSVLLVENLRLRMEEMRLQVETAEAALLEQQQRNEDLVTQGSQQRMKIATLLEQQRQNERLAIHNSQQHMEIAELQGLLRKSRRRVEELEKLVQEKQEPAIPAAGGLLRDVSHYTEMAETDTPDADVAAEVPEPQSEPQAVQVQVREGRWRTWRRG